MWIPEGNHGVLSPDFLYSEGVEPFPYGEREEEPEEEPTAESIAIVTAAAKAWFNPTHPNHDLPPLPE